MNLEEFLIRNKEATYMLKVTGDSMIEAGLLPASGVEGLLAGEPEGRLARVVAIATRIEPELLRQARLQLLRSVDAGAEADLWFSPLVESTTPLALTLFPAVADLLRHQLAESKETLADAWAVLEAVHESAPAAIKLEERVTWKTLLGDPESRADIENELMSVVSAIVTQNRSGLARWALRAVPRFPEAARQTKAATTLVLTAAAHLGAWHMLDEQIESKTLRTGFINDLRLMLPADLPTVSVGVSLLVDSTALAQSAVLTTSPPGYVVEFSAPPASELEQLISVPGTNPLMLEVSWGEHDKQQSRNLSLYQGRPESIKVNANEVRIRTAGGDLYTLRRDLKDVKAEPETRSSITRIPPPPLVGYVARHYSGGRDILEQLKAELAPGRTRVVQIWGPGGTGKTVIAAEAARALLDEFRQRVVWLTAEGRSDFSLSSLLDGIGEQLGRPELRRLNLKSKTSELLEMLSSEPTLIVVDNFEMIKPSEQARCFTFLKKAECLVLLLSRQRIDGPYNLVLGRMLTNEAVEFLDRLLKQVKNPRDFDDLDRKKLIRISECNPLVMQSLVAQIELTKNPREVLDRVARSKGGDPMVRVFEISFNLRELGDDGRILLLALALFVPGASRTALAEVAGFEKNLQRLNEAADRLITLRLANSGADERLSVGGLIRNLLQARLSRDRRAKQIRRRFVAYFLAYAQSYAEPTAENFDALELEFENLLDAMDISNRLQSANQLIQIYQVLSGFLDVRGYWDEALRRNTQAQNAARKLKRPELQPDLIQIAADIFLRRREFPKAKANYQAALASYRSTENHRGSATALRKLGSIALEQANPVEAEKPYNESLAISREINDQAGVADNLHNLAIVAQERYDLQTAEALYLQSLEISQQLDDPGSVAVSYHQLGVIAEEKGNFEEAQKGWEIRMGLRRHFIYSAA